MSQGYWRNRKRACLASTRYWDRNPDTPEVRYGVVGNISACHADARGSIPRFGVNFFFCARIKKNFAKKKKEYTCRDSNSGFPACEAGVITGLDHTCTPPGLVSGAHFSKSFESPKNWITSAKSKKFPNRDSNPGRVGENHIS